MLLNNSVPTDLSLFLSHFIISDYLQEALTHKTNAITFRLSVKCSIWREVLCVDCAFDSVLLKLEMIIKMPENINAFFKQVVSFIFT